MVSFRWSSVVSQKLGQMTEDEIWNSPVGTGPYTCVENVSGSYATFKRNEDYWGDKPAAEEITIRYYAEETTMMIDLGDPAPLILQLASLTTMQSVWKIGEARSVRRSFPPVI